MTRVNVIPVSELSDQHLIAEYHELPRVIKQNIDISNAPQCFVLGTGHMRWARAHWKYTCDRFCNICREMEYRGFNVNFAPESLYGYMAEQKAGEYTVTDADIEKNRERIREKYNKKPEFYRWTRRQKPKWL
jgi:deoxyribonuclease (pyrimidine dimer)